MLRARRIQRQPDDCYHLVPQQVWQGVDRHLEEARDDRCSQCRGPNRRRIASTRLLHQSRGLIRRLYRQGHHRNHHRRLTRSPDECAISIVDVSIRIKDGTARSVGRAAFNFNYLAAVTACVVPFAKSPATFAGSAFAFAFTTCSPTDRIRYSSTYQAS
jgi:hypothetical protein